MATRIVTGSITKVFSSYDSNYATRTLTSPEKAYVGTAQSSTTSYCGFSMVMGNYAESYIYFKFDTSELANLPSNTTITSIACKSRAWVVAAATQNNRFSDRWMQMCSGTTGKSNKLYVGNNTNIQSFTPGTWTLSELSDVRVLFYFKRTTTNSGVNYTGRIYGGDITINYQYEEEVPGPEVFYKQNGSWVQADSVYVKNNGVWVQADSVYVKNNGTWNS